MNRLPTRNVRLSCTYNTYETLCQHPHVCDRDSDELTRLEREIKKRNHHPELCHRSRGREPQIWKAMTTLVLPGLHLPPCLPILCSNTMSRYRLSEKSVSSPDHCEATSHSLASRGCCYRWSVRMKVVKRPQTKHGLVRRARHLSLCHFASRKKHVYQTSVIELPTELCLPFPDMCMPSLWSPMVKR